MLPLKVSISYIAVHHSVTVKVVGYLTNRVLHHLYPFIAVIVKHGCYYVLKLAVEVISFLEEATLVF